MANKVTVVLTVPMVTRVYMDRRANVEALVQMARLVSEDQRDLKDPRENADHQEMQESRVHLAQTARQENQESADQWVQLVQQVIQALQVYRVQRVLLVVMATQVVADVVDQRVERAQQDYPEQEARVVSSVFLVSVDLLATTDKQDPGEARVKLAHKVSAELGELTASLAHEVSVAPRDSRVLGASKDQWDHTDLQAVTAVLETPEKWVHEDDQVLTANPDRPEPQDLPVQQAPAVHELLTVARRMSIRARPRARALIVSMSVEKTASFWPTSTHSTTSTATLNASFAQTAARHAHPGAATICSATTQASTPDTTT